MQLPPKTFLSQTVGPSILPALVQNFATFGKAHYKGKVPMYMITLLYLEDHVENATREEIQVLT
jgi:hypothetical protein